MERADVMSVMAGVRRLVGVVAVLGLVLAGAACGGMPDEDAGSQTSAWEPPPGYRGDPLPDGVEVVQQGFTGGSKGSLFYVSAGAVLENTTDSAVAFPLTFVPLDKDGQSLNMKPSEDQTYGIVAIAAGAQVSVGLTDLFWRESLWEKVTAVEAATYPGYDTDGYLHQALQDQPDVTMEADFVEFHTEHVTRGYFGVTMEVTNPYNESIQPFGFGAVYRDESGAIIGGHTAPNTLGMAAGHYSDHTINPTAPGTFLHSVQMKEFFDGSIPHTFDITAWPVPRSTEIPDFYDPA